MKGLIPIIVKAKELQPGMIFETPEEVYMVIETLTDAAPGVVAVMVNNLTAGYPNKLVIALETDVPVSYPEYRIALFSEERTDNLVFKDEEAGGEYEILKNDVKLLFPEYSGNVSDLEGKKYKIYFHNDLLVGIEESKSRNRR